MQARAQRDRRRCRMNAAGHVSNPTDERFTEAARWFFRLQADDVSPAEFAEWLQWYELEPENRLAFENAQATFESARQMPAADRKDWAELLLAAAPVQRSSGALALGWISQALFAMRGSWRVAAV